MHNWRLIIHPKTNGAMNMAIDESLLESVSAHRTATTLRLYDWDPYTLSLGHAQPFSEINLNALQEYNWGLVRRPTGGKAILHADELTYSITASDDDPIATGNVIESYRRISSGLLNALSIINIEADSKPKDAANQSDSKSPVCFQYPSDYEITYGGKKLIGSAQARKKNGILQHGTVPLFGDIARIVLALNFPNDSEKEKSRQKIISRATTISNILGKVLSWDEMANAMKCGFEQALNITFQLDELSAWEDERSKQIYFEKYSNPEWNERI